MNPRPGAGCSFLVPEPMIRDLGIAPEVFDVCDVIQEFGAVTASRCAHASALHAAWDFAFVDAVVLVASVVAGVVA